MSERKTLDEMCDIEGARIAQRESCTQLAASHEWTAAMMATFMRSDEMFRAQCAERLEKLEAEVVDPAWTKAEMLDMKAQISALRVLIGGE